MDDNETTVTVGVPTTELSTEVTTEQLAANAAQNAVQAAEQAQVIARGQALSAAQDAAEEVAEVREELEQAENDREWMQAQLTTLNSQISDLQLAQITIAERLEALALPIQETLSEEVIPEAVVEVPPEVVLENDVEDHQEARTERPAKRHRLRLI